MKRLAIALAASAFLAAPAIAAGDDVVTKQSGDSFADVAQAVSDAIINRGYTIDYHGFIGEMLKRTADDVGAKTELYKDAEFFTFCSAVVLPKRIFAFHRKRGTAFGFSAQIER